MFGIGPMELIVVLVIALIVVGPEKLPQLAGQIGKAIRDFRQMSGDVTGEFQRAFQLDEPQPQQASEPAVTPNGVSDDVPTLSAQVIEPEAPIEAPAAVESAAPAATDYSYYSAPPLATKEDPLAGASLLDEPEPPAPVTTTYESQAVAAFAAPAGEEPAPANGIADAWDAVLTTDATISLPEPTAAELHPELAGAAVAVAEREEDPAAAEAPAEEEPGRPRVDPNAEVTIREVIEGQVAAEAFRERRRIATYRRSK